MMVPLAFLLQRYVKNSEKSMKIVTTRKENLNIFLTTQGISIKFSVKMTIMKILKVTKTRASPSLSRRYIFEKTTGGTN